MKLTNEQKIGLYEASKPLMEWLAKCGNERAKAVIDRDSCELVHIVTTSTITDEQDGYNATLRTVQNDGVAANS